MTADLIFTPPQITDDDVAWVTKILSLPDNAFGGTDGKDPRLHILKTNQTMDVEACPGSGKTTLLVAKLAILARKWTDLRRGICVLSHTNVARRQIENSLGFTPEGTRLLSYPHYVGTIHGFVNEFLAIPWLRSQGYPATVIDDAQCEQHRRRLLRLAQFSALNSYVTGRERNPRVREVGGWHIGGPDFNGVTDKGRTSIEARFPAPSRQLPALLRKCAQDGYHRYAEMFIWAHDLISNHPDCAAALRVRFPMVFIDEVQDNSEDQSALLHRVFMEGEKVCVRQRYGDSNQAIYGHVEGQGASSDLFPQEDIRRDVPNSLRFGQKIADFADPLGLVPQSLVGRGSLGRIIKSDTSRQHTIFLFEDETIHRVLPAFCEHLVVCFTSDELTRGTFVAVGAVHVPRSDEDMPRHLRHYWAAYDHQLNSSEPKPTTFYQHIIAGRKTTFETGEAFDAIEKIADGILRLARLVAPSRSSVRRRKHSQILESLSSDVELKARYLNTAITLANPATELSPAAWDTEWSHVIVKVASVIAGRDFRKSDQADFLEWPASGPATEPVAVGPTGNFYRYHSPAVAVRVASIHAVKGETHTATLVLDTFFHDHNLQELKPWLLGAHVGKGSVGVRMQARLKQHYVAMTRPTHMLCLAMKDTFTSAEISILQSRHWRICRLTRSGSEWLEPAEQEDQQPQ